MPRIICKLEDKYFEFSTIVDAPVTFPMTLDAFKDYYKDEYGRQGLGDLEYRIQRVHEKGTSSRLDKNVEETLRLNRAGKNETNLSMDQLKEWARSDCRYELSTIVGSKHVWSEDD